MLILRPLPPAAADHPDPLLGAYYHGLLSAWGARERLLARAIDRALVGLAPDPEQRRFGIPKAEWPVMRGIVPPAGYASMQGRKGLHALLNPAALPVHANILKDKARFVREAARHGLPVPDTLGPGEDPANWLRRQREVVHKPNFSSHGRGVARWRRSGATWRSNTGVELDTSGLAALGGLLQAALPTHEALAPISPDALPTLRLVTLPDEQGRPEVAFRALRVGGGGAAADNFALGGLAMLVNGEGDPAQAYGRGPDARPVPLSRHPRTGARLDAPLPAGLMRQADALAARAHAVLGEGYSAIAWDVGVTPDGPVLVEGNWNPGANIMQLLDGRPLSAGRLGELYRLALARVPAERWRAAWPVQSA